MTTMHGVSGFGFLHPFTFTKADIARFIVIAAMTASVAGITFLAMTAGFGSVVPQLFYFPILYTTFFYPERSLYIAGACAVIYLVIASLSVMADIAIFAGILFQALLFIAVAAGALYVVRRRDSGVFATPADETELILAMIQAGESDHVEFKRESLWSMELTRDKIRASESAEVQKYGRHAGKFIIARSIAAFLNTDGGELLIGISEDRSKNSISVTGIETDYPRMPEHYRNPDGYRRMLIDGVIRKYLPEIFESAGKFLRFSFPVISGKTVCHVHIFPAHKPVIVDTAGEEHFFIRIDASTRALTGRGMTRYILNRFSPN
jgi:hypothetical protein